MSINIFNEILLFLYCQYDFYSKRMIFLPNIDSIKYLYDNIGVCIEYYYKKKNISDILKMKDSLSCSNTSCYSDAQILHPLT